MKQPDNLITTFAPLAARILMAQLFVIAGLGKLAAFAKTAAFIANRGLPAPEVLLVLTIALEVGGGLLLIIGWKARWIAAALLGFTFIATLVFHAFWAVEAQALKSEMNNFMKNLAIMGGLLYIMAYGAGPFSLDSRNRPVTAAPGPAPKKKRGRRGDTTPERS